MDGDCERVRPAVLSVQPDVRESAGGGIRTPTMLPPTGPKPAAYAISPRPPGQLPAGRLVTVPLLDADLGPQAGDVAGGLDAVHGLLDGAVRVDHERGPDHADGGLAVELLLAVGAISLERGVIRIRESDRRGRCGPPNPGFASLKGWSGEMPSTVMPAEFRLSPAARNRRLPWCSRASSRPGRSTRSPAGRGTRIARPSYRRHPARWSRGPGLRRESLSVIEPPSVSTAGTNATARDGRWPNRPGRCRAGRCRAGRCRAADAGRGVDLFQVGHAGGGLRAGALPLFADPDATAAAAERCAVAAAATPAPLSRTMP